MGKYIISELSKSKLLEDVIRSYIDSNDPEKAILEKYVSDKIGGMCFEENGLNEEAIQLAKLLNDLEGTEKQNFLHSLYKYLNSLFKILIYVKRRTT